MRCTCSCAPLLLLPYTLQLLDLAVSCASPVRTTPPELTEDEANKAATNPFIDTPDSAPEAADADTNPDPMETGPVNHDMVTSLPFFKMAPKS